LPRRSEALGLGEVLPVGEVLGAPASGSWDATSARSRAAGPRAVAPPPPSPPSVAEGAAEGEVDAGAEPATATPHPFLSDLPTSDREAHERSVAPTPPAPQQPAGAPGRPPGRPPDRPPGLWRRLTARWRGGS